MKLHYKGKYDLNPESLPTRAHQPGAVPFREAKDSRQLGIIANTAAIIVTLLLGVLGFLRCRPGLHGLSLAFVVSGLGFYLILFPHEMLHAICFREDVYLYTNLKQGMLFVVGPETMSKGRFVFMSLLPNLVFGVIPYAVGMLLVPNFTLVMFGALAIGAGCGDYYNVFNALTQMPKGARTYLYQFHSYWYIP